MEFHNDTQNTGRVRRLVYTASLCGNTSMIT